MGDSYLGFLVENLWDTRTKFETLNYGAIWVVFVINVVMGVAVGAAGAVAATGVVLLPPTPAGPILGPFGYPRRRTCSPGG